MVDLDTFLTTLYVTVDDFCKLKPAARRRPGRDASLSVSEVVTLAMLSQWYRYRNQRDFCRFARGHLRAAFPRLPDRSQFNRLVRRHRDTIVAFALHLLENMQARQVEYEVLDTTGVPVRNVKRRTYGWLAGMANIGKCTRLGWFNGFRLLIAVTPYGEITGFCFATGSAKEQPMTEHLLALRAQARPAIPSVGQPALGPYVGDLGFAGDHTHAKWRALYGANVISQPQVNSHITWDEKSRRWLHSIRQIVETVYDKLTNFLRLDQERPHDLTGFQANLSAKVALHNFCIWLNRQLGRAPLAFAELLDW
jgi:hypothetical protein